MGWDVWHQARTYTLSHNTTVMQRLRYITFTAWLQTKREDIQLNWWSRERFAHVSVSLGQVDMVELGRISVASIVLRYVRPDGRAGRHITFISREQACNADLVSSNNQIALRERNTIVYWILFQLHIVCSLHACVSEGGTESLTPNMAHIHHIAKDLIVPERHCDLGILAFIAFPAWSFPGGVL
jgi:hypothetical protein